MPRSVFIWSRVIRRWTDTKRNETNENIVRVTTISESQSADFRLMVKVFTSIRNYRKRFRKMKTLLTLRSSRSYRGPRQWRVFHASRNGTWKIELFFNNYNGRREPVFYLWSGNKANGGPVKKKNCGFKNQGRVDCLIPEGLCTNYLCFRKLLSTQDFIKKNVLIYFHKRIGRVRPALWKHWFITMKTLQHTSHGDCHSIFE